MALNELLTTDIGLLSLFTIVFIVVMGAYIFRYALRKMDEDAKNAENK